MNLNLRGLVILEITCHLTEKKKKRQFLVTTHLLLFLGTSRQLEYNGNGPDLGSKDWGLGSSSLVKPKLPHLSNGDGDGNSKTVISVYYGFLGFLTVS